VEAVEASTAFSGTTEIVVGITASDHEADVVDAGLTGTDASVQEMEAVDVEVGLTGTEASVQTRVVEVEVGSTGASDQVWPGSTSLVVVVVVGITTSDQV
jgi:hypothetical protein